MCKKYIYLALIPALIAMNGCKKFLDIKPKDKIIPQTVADFRMLFNDLSITNMAPEMGNMSDDDITLTDAQFNALFMPFTRNLYRWTPQIFVEADEVRSWNVIYSKIYYANTVLEGLAGNQTGTETERNELSGQAHFYKGESFFNLVRTFSKPYDAATASTDLGIPLRNQADINIKPVRATVQQVYDQLLQELDQAEQLLPLTAALNVSPTKAAAQAAKARAYLQMGNYDKALEYADKCLQTKSTLLNYNDYIQTPIQGIIGVFPVTSFKNPEILYLSAGADYIYSTQYNVTPAYLDLHFPVGDKRRELFFRNVSSGAHRFIGNYHDGSIQVGIPFAFSGPTTAEMYLVRAECYARKDQKDKALQDLNTLRIKRITPATYVALTAATAEETLKLVLEERRKELIFRNNRWHDLQRLNKESRFAVTLNRTVNGINYSLPPNDPRYVMPIPINVITISGMPQNPR